MLELKSESDLTRELPNAKNSESDSAVSTIFAW